MSRSKIETINKGNSNDDDNGEVSFDLDELLKEIETDHERNSKKKNIKRMKKE